MTKQERQQFYELLQKAHDVIDQRNVWIRIDNLGKITAVKLRGDCVLISENLDGSFTETETQLFDL